MNKTYFDVLGVSEHSTDAQVKQAWRKAVLSTHPDVGGNASGFALVQDAFAALTTQQLRSDYALQMTSGASTTYAGRSTGPNSTVFEHGPAQHPRTSQAPDGDSTRATGRPYTEFEGLNIPKLTFASFRDSGAYPYVLASAISVCVMGIGSLGFFAGLISLTSPNYVPVAFSALTWWVISLTAAALFAQLASARPHLTSLWMTLMVCIQVGAPYVPPTPVFFLWWLGLSVTASAIAASTLLLATRGSHRYLDSIFSRL